MRTAPVQLIAVTFLVCFGAADVRADKLVSDPNVGRAPQVVVDAGDARLLQKITYDSGYKRLHDVAADLTQLSGVSILSGASPKDWHVRDIPVVVYVKDMPLGKLLLGIADATHTQFAAEKVGKDDKVTSYRIYRRLKEEKEIDNVLEARHRQRLALAAWRWDAMTAYGKSAKELEDLPRSTHLVAKLIASLGPGSKERMLAGEQFEFRGSDSAYRPTIRKLYEDGWQAEQKLKKALEQTDAKLAKMIGRGSRPPTDANMESSKLFIKLVDPCADGDTRIIYDLDLVASGSLEEADKLQNHGLDLAPYPVNAPGDWSTDMRDPDMVALRSDNEWNVPDLTAPIDVDPPKDVKDPTFADLIRSVGRASGLNIVVEDFRSHWRQQRLEGSFAKKTTVARALPRTQSHSNCAWFYDQKDKLLIGWSDGTFGQWTWRVHHRSLLPEAYLTGLASKYKTTGIDFDEGNHIASLPEESCLMWIFFSRDLSRLYEVTSGAGIVERRLWQLYDALTPDDRALAKSAMGFSMMKLDPQAVAGFAREQRMREQPFQNPSSADPEIADRVAQAEKTRLRNARALSDPKVVETMVMRVKQSPAQQRVVVYRNPDGSQEYHTEPPPKELNLSQYNMVIDYKVDGEDWQIELQGPAVAFPMYSPEREAELLKVARK